MRRDIDMMKKSKYTYLLNIEPGILLMYNSYKGCSSFIKFYGDDAVIAANCIKTPDEYIGTKVYEVLIDQGMIVNDYIDEDAICTQIAWKRIFYPGLTLIIMPTEDCNFRCAYCYEEHKNGTMSLKTADSIIKYVTKNISKYTELHVVWFGGEPLMSKETIDLVLHISDELIKICSCARKKYSADIITNGFNLTHATFEQLLNRKVFSYQVTIDGLSDTHDRYRFLSTGEKTHDRIISNLLEIKNNCNKRYFNVVIRTNITSEMETSLYEHYADLSKKFSDDPRFSFFFRPVGDWGGDNVKNLCEHMFDTFSFRKIYEKIADMQLNLNLKFDRFLPFYDNCTCSACYENSYIIGYDGKLYKCSCHFDEPNNQVGNLDINGNMVLDIQKNSMWVKKPKLKETCKTCFFVPACLNMSCPIYANKIRYIKNDIDDCPYEKKYIKETLCLLEKCGYFKTISLTKPE